MGIQLGDPNLYVLKATDLKHLNDERERLDSERSSSGEKMMNGIVDDAAAADKKAVVGMMTNGDCSPSIVDALNNRTNCDNNNQGPSSSGAGAGDSSTSTTTGAFGGSGVAAAAPV